MSTHTVYAYAQFDYDWRDLSKPQGWRTDVWTHKTTDTETRILLHEIKVEAELPPDFNPVPAQVAALEAAKVAALAEYTKSVAEINERLGKLLCIEGPDDGKEFT